MGQSMEEGAQSEHPCSLWAHYSCCITIYSPTQESESSPFVLLWRLHYIDMINLIIDHCHCWYSQPPAPLPSLEVDVGLKVATM